MWTDPESGVNWLVVAGLAKGNHEDRDDFYQAIERADAAAASSAWLPTESDARLLRQETAARIVTMWELAIQRQFLHALRECLDRGSAQIAINHPVPTRGRLADVTVEICPVREAGYASDDAILTFDTQPNSRGSNLEWQMITRALITLDPPEQQWDRTGATFSSIAEPGHWRERVQELEEIVADGRLAESTPGRHAHFTHRRHVAGSTLEGSGVRSLCGVFFVPYQDHEALAECPRCREVYDTLP